MRIMLQVIKIIGTCESQHSKYSQEFLLLIINRCNFCFAPFRVEVREQESKVKLKMLATKG